MKNEQRHQEDEYWFPYHYVSRFGPHFCQHVADAWGINYVSTIEFLLERIEQLDFSSIVDIGCGDGRFTRELALRFPEKQVLGVDYSARAIGLAQAMNHDLPTLEFSARDITHSGKFAKHDLAILMEVFEHIPPETAHAFLDGVHSLLRPGGTLLLTVPHVNQPLEHKHFRHFTIATLRDALMTRFEIMEVVPFERIAASRKLVNLLLVNRVFVLNHWHTLDFLYRFYKRNLFRCDVEAECRRVFVMARAR
jgi:trans-aconitate methyltransferase